MSKGCEVICQQEHLSPIMWQQSYVCVKQTLIPDCFRNIVYWGNLHVMKVIQNHEERSYMPQELIKQFNIEKAMHEYIFGVNPVACKNYQGRIMNICEVNQGIIVHILMACGLISAKSFPEQMLEYCQFDHWEWISNKFETNHHNFHTRRTTRTCFLQNSNNFVCLILLIQM